MGRRGSLLAVWLGITASAFAQDPLVTLPDSYRLQFENDWVKVVRVRYEPHAKLPEHSHPAATIAFVYLGDAGPAVFKHGGSINRSVTRPAVKAGAYRITHSDGEVHSVENDSDRPSEFLRVELKTDSAGVKRFSRRVPVPALSATTTTSEMEFNNAQVRISRLTIADGASADIITPAAEPALVLAVTNSMVSVASRDTRTEQTFITGQEHWIGESQRERITNTGSSPIVLLRFDFLTRRR